MSESCSRLFSMSLIVRRSWSQPYKWLSARVRKRFSEQCLGVHLDTAKVGERDFPTMHSLPPTRLKEQRKDYEIPHYALHCSKCTTHQFGCSLPAWECIARNSRSPAFSPPKCIPKKRLTSSSDNANQIKISITTLRCNCAFKEHLTYIGRSATH